MMILFASLLTLPANASTSFDIKVGLWKMEAKFDQAGMKQPDSEMMKKAMESMPAESRKMMQDMMAKNGVAMGKNGEQLICISKNMLKNPETITPPQQGQNCKTKTIKTTGKEVEMEIHCEDGTDGKLKWKASSSSAFSGVMELKMADGKISKIEQNAKFVKSDCGKLKPLAQ